MKVRVLVPQTGLFNGEPWPKVDEVIDLPPLVAESMAAVGHVEKVGAKAADKADKVEKRPAPDDEVETRAAKKTAAKKS